jgi:hypothetical protein
VAIWTHFLALPLFLPSLHSVNERTIRVTGVWEKQLYSIANFLLRKPFHMHLFWYFFHMHSESGFFYKKSFRISKGWDGPVVLICKIKRTHLGCQLSL